MKTNVRNTALLLAATAMLAGCNPFKKDKKITPTVGDRISVLSAKTAIQVDPETAALPITLPAAVENEDWAQSGGNAVEIGRPCRAWPEPRRRLDRAIGAGIGPQGAPRVRARSSAAAGSIRSTRVGTVRAFDTRNGGRCGRPASARTGKDAACSTAAALAFANGRVYATNGLGYVAALDAATGAVAWTVKPGRPAARRTRRSTAVPSTSMTQDNQIYLAEDHRRRHQLVERRGAGNRRRVRLGRAGGCARHGRRRILRRANSTPIATKTAAWCGRTRCRARRSRPASPRCPTSTPTR